VLVVDDSEVVRAALRHAFVDAGWEVAEAASGADALARVRAGGLDAVTTDATMPGLDGFAFTKAARAIASARSLPIVMVTARDQRVDELRGEDAGVDAFLSKPVDVAQLLRTIDAVVARKRHG
jgi:CheY-like chemotaxis protein